MSIRSLASLKVFFESLPGGSKSVAPLDLTNLNPPEHEYEVLLTSGANVVSIPALAKGVVIIPDTVSTVVKTLKGVSGDTGFIVSKTGWSLVSFDSPPPGSFVIAATAIDPKYTRFVFF